MKCEHWINPEGTTTLIPIDHAQRELFLNDMGPNAKLHCTIEAETWEEVTQKYYTHNRWGKYKSMDTTDEPK